MGFLTHANRTYFSINYFYLLIWVCRYSWSLSMWFFLSFEKANELYELKCIFTYFHSRPRVLFPEKENINNNTSRVKYVHALAHVFQWQLFCFITMTCVQAAFLFFVKAHAVQHVLCVSLSLSLAELLALFFPCRWSSWSILVLLF